MKLKHVISSLCVAMAISFGVFAGVSAHKEAKVAKADTTTEVTASGKIFLQFNTNEWKSTESKVALYMFNNSESKAAWGDMVTPTGEKFLEYSYSLEFVPTGCIAFRLDPSVETLGQWCFDNDRSDAAIWATTNDIDFNNVVWLGDYYTSSKWTSSGSYAINAVVMGGAVDDWLEPTVDTKLTNIKVSGDELEAYGSVTLPAGTYFKVLKSGSEWSGVYEAHSSIASNLSGGGENNIHNTAAATYEFYYKYESKTIYITDPVIAAADEYGQYFLSHVGCDADGKLEPTGWSDCATEYGKLSNQVKDYIYGLTGNVEGSYIEHAVARYDYAVAHHPGLTKFIVNSSSTPRAAIAIEGLEYNHSFEYGYIIIISASVVAVSALALLLLKKRKQK